MRSKTTTTRRPPQPDLVAALFAARCPRSIATVTSRPRRRNSASSRAPSGATSRNSSRGSGGERDQARENRIATRQAHPLAKAPHVLERRSRQDRDGDRRAAEHEARTKRAAHGGAG